MAYITFQPSDYFNTKLYTGNGSTNNITGVGFDPDFSWFKSRAVEVHELYDKVRGAGKRIMSQSTAAQNDEAYQSFITDGFSWSGGGNCNSNGVNFVSWNWLANGQGSANSDGTITTTYTSANTTAGFSIVKYTGTGANATVGHGLGVAPKMIIFKNLNTATDWDVYHGSLANTERIHLNTTGAKNTATHAFNSTSPTTSVFYVGTADNTNKSSSPMIAYCFAEKKGFSKFGSYTGNGNADGTFIYTGFRPAFFMWKRSSSSGGWYISDAKRDTFNEVDVVLSVNDNGSESDQGTTFDHDFLSNGIKLRNSVAAANSSGETFIYMAFAEHPLVSSNGVPATAR